MMMEVHSEQNNVTLVGVVDKPLSCFGCGIGWSSFLLGFVFPPLWYYATVLYFGKYYLKDPRERSGLAASAIAALICSVALLVVLLTVILYQVFQCRQVLWFNHE